MLVFLALTVAVLAVTVVVALLSAWATYRGKPIDNPIFYGLVALEVLLVIMLVVGVATMGSANTHMNKGIFVAYLVGLVVVPPFAGFWAIAERTSRWGTAVLLVATTGLGVMVGRLIQLWNGHA